MQLIVILAVVFGLLFFTFIKVFKKSLENKLLETKDLSESQVNKSVSGYTLVSLSGIEGIRLGFGELGFTHFNKEYISDNLTLSQQAVNNRYCEYSCDFGDQNHGDKDDHERRVPLTIHLQTLQLEFKEISDLNIGTAHDSIIQITFDEQWSAPNVSLEQAYADYKRIMRSLLNLGCKIYFGLEEVRYKKENYQKLLADDYGECLAPDLIQFEEFKAVLESKDYRSLDSYFYIDNVLLYIDYHQDFSAYIEVLQADVFETAVSYFGRDDLDLDTLSAEEKLQKYHDFVEDSLKVRAEYEAQAELDGFTIDRSYHDPFLNKVVIK